MMKLLFSLSFCSLLVFFCYGIESPEFEVIHSTSEFEIRFYKEITWMTAPVEEISFEKATKSGFHRLYQYIHGANSNSSKLVMTAPVLTSITKTSHGLEYYVRYYLSKKRAPYPHPHPELKLQSGTWKNGCIAVRKFSGFARNNNIGKEKEALVNSLGRDAGLNDTLTFAIAQYNAPFRPTGRLNEVWMNVMGSRCGS